MKYAEDFSSWAFSIFRIYRVGLLFPNMTNISPPSSGSIEISSTQPILYDGFISLLITKSIATTLSTLSMLCITGSALLSSSKSATSQTTCITINRAVMLVRENIFFSSFVIARLPPYSIMIMPFFRQYFKRFYA